MKLRWYDRLLVALSGLVLLAIAVLIALVGCGTVTLPDALSIDMVRGGWRMTPLFLLAAMIVAAWGLRLAFRAVHSPRKETGKQYFCVGGGEKADALSISVQALDHLVRRCVEQTPGVLGTSIRIEGEESGIRISLRSTLCADVRIPETVSALQSRIRAYIEECAGVQVSGVQVVVEATKSVSSRKKQNGTLVLTAGEKQLPAAEEKMQEGAMSVAVIGNDLPDEDVEPELIPAQEETEMFSAVEMENTAEAQMTEEEKEAEKEEKIKVQAREELDAAIGVPEKLPVELSGEAFPFPENADA